MTDPNNQTESLDHAKWLHEMAREDQTRAFEQLDRQIDVLNEATIKASEGALRSGLLINGGAAVSVLAFIGTLASKDVLKVGQMNQISYSLTLFALGAASAVLAMGLSYMANYFGACRVYSMKRNSTRPYYEPGKSTGRYTIAVYVVHLGAFAAGAGSIALFIVGVYAVKNAIGHLG